MTRLGLAIFHPIRPPSAVLPMGMKPLPLDSKSKGEPASTQAETIEHPRVLVTTSDHMATTLSWPAAPYTTAPSPYDFRPQLPPLVPAAPRSFVPVLTPYSHTPESLATSPSSTTSRTHIRGPHTHSQQISIGDNNVSTAHPRRFSGEDSSIDSSSIPPRGAKRQLGAQTPKRYHFEIDLSDQG